MVEEQQQDSVKESTPESQKPRVQLELTSKLSANCNVSENMQAH